MMRSAKCPIASQMLCAIIPLLRVFNKLYLLQAHILRNESCVWCYQTLKPTSSAYHRLDKANNFPNKPRSPKIK